MENPIRTQVTELYDRLEADNDGALTIDGGNRKGERFGSPQLSGSAFYV